MGGLRFASKCSLKKLLGCDIVAAIQLNDTSVVKGIGIARQRQFCAQSCLGHSKISPSASRHFGNRGILLYQAAKQIARFGKTPAGKLLMRGFEGAQSCRLVERRLRWR